MRKRITLSNRNYKKTVLSDIYYWLACLLDGIYQISRAKSFE